jgi:uncharacterized protein YaaN involved in tellurite resistance
MSETRNQPDPAQPAGSGAFWDLDPAAAERLDRVVEEFVETLARLEPGRKEYPRAAASIDRLGQREFTATTALSRRMVDRRLHAEHGFLAAKAPLAHCLAELRRIVDELDPSRIDLGSGKLRGLFGRRARREGLDELAHYFDRFSRSQGHLEEILQTLAEGRLELERDNAQLSEEEVSLVTVMETLREHAYMAGRLDEALTARIDAIAAGDPERADRMRSDLLHAIRRRRQEILTQLAVATQGYSSLRIVRESNDELARAIATATTTTAGALRTAVMVAQAVTSQRLAQENMEAANEAAAEMAGGTSSLMERQSGAMRDSPASASERLATLRQAWDDVSVALNRLEAQKEQALRAVSSPGREPAQSEGGTADSSAGSAPGE